MLVSPASRLHMSVMGSQESVGFLKDSLYLDDVSGRKGEEVVRGPAKIRRLYGI